MPVIIQTKKVLILLRRCGLSSRTRLNFCHREVVVAMMKAAAALQDAVIVVVMVMLLWLDHTSFVHIQDGSYFQQDYRKNLYLQWSHCVIECICNKSCDGINNCGGGEARIN